MERAGDCGRNAQEQGGGVQRSIRPSAGAGRGRAAPTQCNKSGELHAVDSHLEGSTVLDILEDDDFFIVHMLAKAFPGCLYMVNMC
jgi:hypothetical protein